MATDDVAERIAQLEREYPDDELYGVFSRDARFLLDHITRLEARLTTAEAVCVAAERWQNALHTDRAKTILEAEWRLQEAIAFYRKAGFGDGAEE